MADVSLTLIVLKSHDMDRARHFYESIGLSFVEEKHGNGPAHFSAAVGDTVIEIYPLSVDQRVDDTTRLGFAIANVDTILATVESTGGRVIATARETPWGYRAVIADPDGRSVEVSRQ